MTDTVRVPREAGHCNDDAAWAEFERQYRGQPRSFGHMTDFELANAVFMADRYSFELISYQTAAKERIRWLSLRLAEATAMLAASPQGEGSSADAAPIKPSADTGELRERVAQIIGEAVNRRAPGQIVFSTLEDADAILDLIQSERAG